MNVPSHTDQCREHWGCHPSCLVASMALELHLAKTRLAQLEARMQLDKRLKPKKKPDAK